MAFSDFDLQEELHRGNASIVWRAIDRRSGQAVAVKRFKKGNGPVPERYGEAEGLHLNLVRVLESGRTGEGQAYVSMEWCPGGSLDARLARGIRAEEFKQVIASLAEALEALHQAGLAHGDVKPSNVLFRESGEPVLIDSLSTGGQSTPGYRSPEFERTGSVSLASDFYSLGVLLFRGLAGTLPWTHEDGSARSRRSGEELPHLPASVTGFASVLDRLLAFDPTMRPADTCELRTLLDQVQSSPRLGPSAHRSDLVATEEVLDVARVTRAGGPRLDQAGAGNSRRRWVFWPFAIAGLILMAFVGVYVLQGVSPVVAAQLAQLGFGEHPGLAATRQTAESLDADPNQSLSAITAAYNAVLQISPEDERARAAIDSVRSRWKADISTNIDQGNLALSRSKLTDALAVYPNDPDFQALFDRIATRNRVEALLADTRLVLDRAGIEAGRSAVMAIHNYLEVLRLDPGNEEATTRLDELAGHYGARAAAAAESGELAQAIELIGTAAMASADLPYLEEVREVIGKARTLQDAKTEMLQEAASYRADGRLIEPQGANAAELYSQVLALDPENDIAAQGLSEVSSRVVQEFEASLDQRRFGKVDRLLSRAVDVGLEQESIGLMQARYSDVQRQINNADKLVQEAIALMAKGLITQPIERNAVSQLREAMQLDPLHPHAQTLLNECGSRLVAVAEEAYSVGLKAEASLYLDLALTVHPDEPGWQNLRKQWLAEVSTSLHRGGSQD